jgi:hypothetical protein
MPTGAACSEECGVWLVPSDPRRRHIRAYERAHGIPDRWDWAACTVWGVFQAYDQLQHGQCAVDTLNALIACMRWIGDETARTVLAMAPLLGLSREAHLDPFLADNTNAISEPEGPARPSHRFVSHKRHTRRLRQRLRACMGWMDARVSAPPEWSRRYRADDDTFGMVLRSGPMIWPGAVDNLLEIPPSQELLEITWLKAHLLRRVLPVHMRNIINEFTAWRLLPCAMALHPRVGDASALGALGEDLLRLVLEYV